MTTARRLTVLVMVLALGFALGGCKKEAEEPALQPKIAPPVIGEEGVLRAGVDLDYPPFAGEDGDQEAGIDVDIAATIAERLGLRLELVDVKPGEVASALNDGEADIVLGATPITDAILADVSSAGSYLVDAPAFFSLEASESADTTLTAGDLPGKRIAAQQGSPAFWELESEFGEGFVTAFPSLREAFEALEAGDIDVVVGDAAVGAYIIRDFEGIGFAGQYLPGQPFGVAVKKDATELETEVRAILDEIAADGTLDTIRRKWLGTLPQLEVETAG